MLKKILSLICFLLLSGCAALKQEEPTATLAQKPLEIAILMPLTGENELLGRACDKLIKMGLSDSLGTDINATSYDVSTNTKALAAIDKIVETNTKIILGPMYSETTKLISGIAKEHGIIIITMSNDPTLADDTLFVFGHAPLKQNERIINYFLAKKHKYFISLLPQGSYSQAVSKVMQDMILQEGASLIKAQFYENNPVSIDNSVKALSEIVDEINEKIDEDNDANFKPIIYLSDDNKNLQLVFNSILKYDLDQKAIIIGDNRIDIEYSDPIDLVFTGSLNIMTTDIKNRAKDIAINHMSFLHKLAYDLGKMTASYIGDSFNKDYFLKRLNSMDPYNGLSGETYFVDSIAQRKYDVIFKKRP